MIYAITHTDFKNRRRILFDKDQALIFDGSNKANEQFDKVSERLADLLDGSPVVTRSILGRKTEKRTNYPQEKIAYWRQCLQTLAIVPFNELIRSEIENETK